MCVSMFLTWSQRETKTMPLGGRGGGGGQDAGEQLGGEHPGAAAQHRVEGGVREPRLVPQEAQVGLDGQALLHHLR